MGEADPFAINKMGFFNVGYWKGIEDSVELVCNVLAPQCSFELMDATKLEFPDASFDNMLCVESAYHFVTRYRFFQEANRVLKPGGRLGH